MSDLSTRYTGPDGQILKQAHARFDMGEEASKDQRVRNEKALRFINDDQWPEDIKNLRAGNPGNANNGMPAVPARPCITINKVKEPVKQVVNQMSQSDMGAEITPADDFGDLTEVDDEEIELREGLLRRIQRAPETADAILWMGKRAAICGEGYMGVMTRFLKGKTFDQEPYVMRFYNQASVMLDPSHEQPDGSDADWAIVGSDMPYDQYIAEFPKALDGKSANALCDCNDDAWRAFGDEAPGWFTTEGEQRMVRVVDYYYTVRDSEELALLPDGRTVLASEVPDGIKPLQTRHEVTKSIKWAKLDGYQVLDKTDWPGPDIPIIKCLGEEVSPYDKERRAVGMVSESAQQSNFSGNVMVSKMVETIGLAPIAQIMMANGQDEGFEAEMAGINTRTFGVLHYNQTDAEGKPAPPPMPVPITTQIGPIVTAMQYFNESVLSVIGQPSPTLGEVDPSIKTARGLKDLLNQAERGNSNYLDNLAKSVRRMCVILNGLFYPLLAQGRGRKVRIINSEGEPEMVTISTDSAKQLGMGGEKVYRLTKDAHFNIAIKITANADSRRDKESSMLGDLISANPEFMQWFGDKFIDSTDIPGRKELAERVKVMLAPPILAMLAEKAKGTPIPPHAQAQIAQAKAAIEELTAANQELLKERETDGVKQQAETQRAQMQDETKKLIEQLKASSDEQITAIKLAFDQWKVEFEAEQAAITREDEQRHELALKAADAAQAEKDAEASRQHEANMGRQSAEAGELAGESGHRRSLEQGAVAHEQSEVSAERAAEREAQQPEANA